MKEEDVEKIHPPLLTVDREASEPKYQQHCELYDGILKVEQRGMWRLLVLHVRHLHPVAGRRLAFMDMIDRPEWVHKVMRQMTDGHARAVGLAGGTEGAFPSITATSASAHRATGFTDELPQPDFNGTVRCQDMWGHASTQIFVDVSPAMHEEFALQYEGELLARFGIQSYGCCEPLHHKVDICRKHLPRLRRISMSPWANYEIGAAACGKDLIFAYKPNPAIMAGETWDAEQMKADIRRVVEIAHAHGCPVEILMKDLHTCHGHPERMADWTRVAVEVAEEFPY